MTNYLEDLEQDFDDDLAKSLLGVSIDRAVSATDVVAKAMYNFDLTSPEGVDRLLELLPIIDFEILKEVYQEVFPGYPVDTLAPRTARIELRGFFMDYLHDTGQTEEAEAAATEAPSGRGAGAETSEVPMDAQESTGEGSGEV